jgi:hypothetical protein
MARQISCPSCGGPLQIESAYTTLLVCNYCGASLYVRDTGVDVTGKTAKLADFASRFSIGKTGKVKGRAFRVLGRVRYQNEDGFFDEWFIQFDDQQVGWINEDEGDLTLIFKSKLTAPLPPFDSIKVGSFVALGNDRVFVSEKGNAKVLGAEGELMMSASPGRPVQYVEGNAGNKFLRVLIDDSGMMLHTGEPLQFKDVVMDS